MIINTLNNLSGILSRQGTFDEAEDVRRRILATYEDMEATKEGDTTRRAMPMNLGITHMIQNKLQEAEEEVQQALVSQETRLGPHHRHILMNVAWFGKLYTKMYEVLKAAQAYQRV